MIDWGKSLLWDELSLIGIFVRRWPLVWLWWKIMFFLVSILSFQSLSVNQAFFQLGLSNRELLDISRSWANPWNLFLSKYSRAKLKTTSISKMYVKSLCTADQIFVIAQVNHYRHLSTLAQVCTSSGLRHLIHMSRTSYQLV